MNRLKTPSVVIAVTLIFALATSGCGTLMHPERRTAIPSNKIDAKTAVLDCLWLLVGVIPGVVALGVDFYNDTIYYSEDELKAQGGDNVSVNIRGRSPADSLVTLRLLDRDGCDMGISTEVRSCAGSELGTPLTLTIPEGIEIEGAKLILAVEGRPQVTWTLRPGAG